jgi:hypothetical protein
MRCRYCVAPLTNGAITCCDECSDGWFRIIPCTDGELWGDNGSSPILRTIATAERFGYAKLVERLRKTQSASL